MNIDGDGNGDGMAMAMAKSLVLTRCQIERKGERILTVLNRVEKLS